jgi:hypothetical protein
MSYSEFRVRKAFDVIGLNWLSQPDRLETMREFLHDEDTYDIYDVFDDVLGSLNDEMTDDERDEVIRRLKNVFPQGDDEEDDEEGEVEDEEGNNIGRVRVLRPDEGCECEACEVGRRPFGDLTSDASETPAEFEARRARLWRTFETVMSPREIRAMIRNTRR